MTKRIRLSYIAALIITLLISLITICLRTYLLYNRFDPQRGYFTDNSGRSVTFILIFTVFVQVIYSVCLQRGVSIESDFSGSANMLSCTFVSVVLLAYTLISGINFGNTSYYKLPFLISIVLSLAAIPYFISQVIRWKNNNEHRAIMCMLVIAFFMLYSVLRFLLSDMPANSPIKATELSAVVSVILFFIYECRTVMGRTISAMSVMTGLSSLLLSSVSSVPNLIYTAGKNSLSDRSVYDFILFSLSIYILVRMIYIASPENLIKKTISGRRDNIDLVYATKSEKDNFSISDIKLSEQSAGFGDTYSVREDISEKINDGTEDIPSEDIPSYENEGTAEPETHVTPDKNVSANENPRQHGIEADKDKNTGDI